MKLFSDALSSASDMCSRWDSITVAVATGIASVGKGVAKVTYEGWFAVSIRRECTYQILSLHGTSVHM